MVGVARSRWDLASLRRRARESIERAGGVDDRGAGAAALLAPLRGRRLHRPKYFARLKQALGCRRAGVLPRHSALGLCGGDPGLGASGLAEGARVIVEKPFGRDLASAQELNRVAHSVFPEDSIFRIDHFLGKEAIVNILYFRFANSFLEPIWNRNHVASVQITLCGGLRRAGTRHILRDCRLPARRGPEPFVPNGGPAGHGAAGLSRLRGLAQRETQGLQGDAAAEPDDLVRGQFIGYRDEPGVAKDSDVETFCAVRLFIDSWRWAGVPWYMRSGKRLPATAAEVLVELKPPPQRLFADSRRPRAAPIICAFASPRPADRAGRARQAGRRGVHRRPTRAYLLDTRPTNAALRTAPGRRDGRQRRAVHARGRCRGRLGSRRTRLATHHPACPYEPGSWGPKEADAIISPCGSWHNPEPDGMKVPSPSGRGLGSKSPLPPGES